MIKECCWICEHFSVEKLGISDLDHCKRGEMVFDYMYFEIPLLCAEANDDKGLFELKEELREDNGRTN